VECQVWRAAERLSRMRGPPNLLTQIGSPTPRFAARCRVPDRRSAARS
jgi:hypothetical protein